MERRQFLAAAGAGASTMLTGCTVPGGSSQFGLDERTVRQEGRQYVYRYSDGAVPRAQYTVLFAGADARGTVRMRISLTPFDALVHDGFRFSVAAPIADAPKLASVSVVPPPWPPLTVTQRSSTGTVISAGEFEHASSSLQRFSFLIHTEGEPLEHVEIDASARFRDDGFIGQTYRFDGSDTYDLPFG